MSESTKSVHPDGASTPTASGDHPDVVLVGAPEGPATPKSPSVRELLAELAQLEDATRGLGGVRRPRWTAQTPDLLAARAREQEIIEELHRRCPDTRLVMGSTPSADVADDGSVLKAD